MSLSLVRNRALRLRAPEAINALRKEHEGILEMRAKKAVLGIVPKNNAYESVDHFFRIYEHLCGTTRIGHNPSTGADDSRGS